MSRTCAPFAPAVHAAVWLALGRAIAFDYSAAIIATAQERRNEPSDAETSSAALRRLATSRKRRTCLAHMELFERDAAWREDA
jgi:predicted metal-dependent phosphotriesterase family hydrolase